MDTNNLQEAIKKLVLHNMTLEYRLCISANFSDNEARKFAISKSLHTLRALYGRAPDDHAAFIKKLSDDLDKAMEIYENPAFLDMPDFDGGAEA